MPNIPQQVTNFPEHVDNIVRIIKHGKREQKLFIIGLLCLGPILLPEALKANLLNLLPVFFKPAFSWLLVISITCFLWGFVLVFKKAAPHQMVLTSPPKPSVIKGPFAFGEMDGEIFLKLGRQADLKKILSWVLDSQICFVALQGASGAGKTSLLRAGLTYTLDREKEEHGIIPIYWEAVPENSAAELLRVILRACPEEKERLQNLDDLVDKVSDKKKVIIIDQAEQLSPENHPALFDLFKKIVAQKPPYTVTWIVAFREEYASIWFDFEAASPNFLPPKHSLKIFTEPQAREIIAVLAKESGLVPDNTVIVEMVNAMSDKGKVSPVEIGIGMMMLSEFYSGPEGKISLGKFKDVGGVTGLLRNYIKGKLEDQIPEHEHSGMQNALLDLVDPKTSNQRLSQGKSASELANTGQLSLNRMQHNLDYLIQVRILEQIEQPEHPVRYRLTHERMIPALESLGGELLAAAARAKRLLDERHLTWVKARHRKFLLSGRELRDVLKYHRHFTEDLSPELLHYMRQSKKTRNLKISLSILFVLSLFLWRPFIEKFIEPVRREQRLKKFTAQFVAVEGGVFNMGDSSGDGSVDEKPTHKVKLTNFKISAYEITNQQYCDFLNADDSAKVKAYKWLDFSNRYNQIRENGGRFVVFDKARKDDPVATVSWFGAAAFCNYLSKRNGYKPFYNVNDWSYDFSAKGFRLPTEAEWEYAARGGTKSKSYRYSGSDSIDVVAWYDKNSNSMIHTVGKKQPNELGLYDMSGNVHEWCQDWYGREYYEACRTQGVVENPKGSETGFHRVMRGGRWDGPARYCRSTFRPYNFPSYRSYGTGFRLVFVP